MERIPALQGLRALAVLLVVVYHAWPAWVPGGYLGVDVFFAISGYLISALLLRELDRSGTIDFARFYARRIRRLAPAMVFVTVCVMCISWVFQAPLEQKMLTSDAISTIVYLSNFWFASLATDYLTASHHSALLHSWSLSVEEQFYLVWPTLLWLLSRSTKRSLSVIVGISAVGLVSWALCLYVMTWAQPWAFFSSPTRAWEFAAGALVAVVAQRGVPALTFAPVTQWAAMLTLLACAFGFSARTTHPGLITVVPVAATCLLLGGLADTRSWLSRALAVRPAILIGDISYSLYLWHWPVLVLTRDVLRFDSTAALLTAVATAFVLAGLTYVLVEQPLRRSTALSKRPVTSIAALSAVSAMAVAGIFVMRTTATSASLSPEQRRYTEASSDRPKVYASGCHAGYFDTRLAPCERGATHASATVVLIGDSHAAHWAPALDAWARRRGLRLITLTKSGCPALVFEPVDHNLGRRYVECTTWGRAAVAKVAALQPALVVLSLSRGYLDDLTEQDVRTWQGGVERAAESLLPLTRRLVLLSDVPRPGFDVPMCLARAQWRGESTADACSFVVEDEQRVHELMWPTKSVLNTGAARIDVGDLVCAEKPCPTERDGTVVYADSDHLTASFSRSLAQAVGLRLDEVMARRRVASARMGTAAMVDR